ncbi:hypothetical protein SAMN05421505_1241 [Sinosporangium album]|uniref:ChrB N-terminal domain-containing protein n=1 Tax=Sinosporangium album TaxID=504805 RepID=A0A1G8FM22_9ACTN|nr:Chromate resistance protein ChrB [Sinosporangium album]SDH83129.1 hypothetical protein SAMN05421505_1241 [Sinosporangium album]
MATEGHEPPYDRRFLQLIYRVPSHPSRSRVAVWRELKRLGAVYVQQAVCVLPEREGVRELLDRVRERIDHMGGESMLFVLDHVEDRERHFLVSAFRENSAKEYAEVVEECEALLQGRAEAGEGDRTAERAEELRQDLDRLRRLLQKVEERDWMGGSGRAEAHGKVAECERMLVRLSAGSAETAGL